MEELTNQSEQLEQTQVDTQPEQTQQTPDTTQESYFEVKYNKEPVKVSYDEAPTYIQKGLNYDKVQQQAETYQQQLDRAARLAGYQSHDELVSALDEIEKQQERQQYEQAGIDPDVLDKYWEKKKQEDPDFQYAANLKAQYEAEQKLQAEANELFLEFPNLKPEDIKPEVFQLQATKGLSLLDAYLRVNYKSLGQQAEQQAIQKLTLNQQTSTGALGSEGAEHQRPSVKDMSKSDFESLIQRVKRGERVDL